MPDKHILVVGGTKGIGKVLVEHLISVKNTNVSVFGRSKILNYVEDSITEYEVDVTNKEISYKYIDNAIASYGKLTSIVFLQRNRSNDDSLNNHFDIAINSTKNIVEYAVNKEYFSITDDPNSIVVVSSIADQYIAHEQPLGYHIAKASISQLARYYALKLGPMKIRVNSVSPCVVLKDEAKEFYDKQKTLLERYKKYIPLGRMGKPEDIVDAIMFLVGNKSNYITGQNIIIDGGLTLRGHESLIRDITQE